MAILSNTTGQANLSSKVSANQPNIIHKLSRSITGRGMGLHVQQHFGYRLHLVWNTDTGGIPFEMCM
jgi:hypothetical protein